jgi:hypothetical protein
MVNCIYLGKLSLIILQCFFYFKVKMPYLHHENNFNDEKRDFRRVKKLLESDEIA